MRHKEKWAFKAWVLKESYKTSVCRRSEVRRRPIDMCNTMSTIAILQPKPQTQVDIDDVRDHMQATLAVYKAAGVRWILSGWFKSAVKQGNEIAKGTRFHITAIRPERVLPTAVLRLPERHEPDPVVVSIMVDRAVPQQVRGGVERCAAPAAARGEDATTSDGRTAHPDAAPTDAQVGLHWQ